jgi:hypothetical protein
MAVDVPKLFMLRAFDTWVFVAVMMKALVTVRFDAITFPSVTRPDVAVTPSLKIAAFRTVRVFVDVSE